MITPMTLSQSQAARFLGYSVSSFRRLYRAGDLPGPIDASLAPKLLRWSRPLLEEYQAEGRAVLAADWTPPRGIVRPSLRSVS